VTWYSVSKLSVSRDWFIASAGWTNRVDLMLCWLWQLWLGEEDHHRSKWLPYHRSLILIDWNDPSNVSSELANRWWMYRWPPLAELSRQWMW
jgi:hypothetical protein